MINVRYATLQDKEFWFSLDKHLAESDYEIKLLQHQLLIVEDDDISIGVLRYGLFWDSIPFCNMLYIKKEYQGKGYGRFLTKAWETEMKHLGYDMLMVSTQENENAQYFYRKHGYIDCGYLDFDQANHKQPRELVFSKKI